MRKKSWYLSSVRKEQLDQFKLLEIKDFFTNKGIQLKHTKKQIRSRISYKFWKPIVALCTEDCDNGHWNEK
jgi:hypothetical protein